MSILSHPALLVESAMLLARPIVAHPGNGLWSFFQLAGAFVSESFTLGIIWLPRRAEQHMEPLSRKERLAWTLIGCATITQSCGDALWRSLQVIPHLAPFPSWADAGYALFPPLVLSGLLGLFAPHEQSDQTFTHLDSFIVMGSLLGLLLPGSLTTAGDQNWWIDVLRLYYALSGIILLGGCTLLLLRLVRTSTYQVRALRLGLGWLGIGVMGCVLSDLFLHQQSGSASTVDDTWAGLVWLLGLLIIAIAASLRRFLPDSSTNREAYQKRLQRPDVSYLAVYALVGWLLLALCLNVASTDDMQLQQRWVVLISVGLTLVLLSIRQIATITEHQHLQKERVDIINTVKYLMHKNGQIEGQNQQATQHLVELEQGITHLQEVLAEWANGNQRVRVPLLSGKLLPLASSLNLMADRFSAMKKGNDYLQRLTRALNGVSSALEKHRSGQPLSLPEAYRQFPEIRRLLLAMDIKEATLPSLPHHEGAQGTSPIPQVASQSLTRSPKSEV